MNLDKLSLWKIWLIFFLYAFIVAIFVQFVILPYIFPQWHAGDGLLISNFDSQTYHKIAVELANKIHLQGWSAWQLRPEGHSTSGIASAIYAITTPKPWVLIPINAAMHAASATILLLLIQLFISNRKFAILCVLPFFIYPSAMIWYTQVLKDGYFILGISLFIYGYAILAKSEIWFNSWMRVLRAILCIIIGILIVWIARPYMINLLQYTGTIISFLLTFAFIRKTLKRNLPWNKIVVIVMLMWIIIMLQSPLKNTDEISKELINKTATNPSITNPSITNPSITNPSITNPYPKKTLFTRFVSFIENKVHAVVRGRDGFRFTGGASNIDSEITFNNMADVIIYLPRALQIAFLAPFPEHWFGQGSMPPNTLMRKISAFEMIGIYFALIFLPYTLYYWRKRIEIWIIFIFCSNIMLIQALVITNIGTLYRIRYGFLMTLAALGIAGFIQVFQKFYNKRNNRCAV